MKDLGQTIKKIRLQKYITQEYVADQLGITQGSYVRMINEKTGLSVKRLYEIADILETSIEELLNINTSEVFNNNNDSSKNNGNIFAHQIQKVCATNEKQQQKIEALYESKLQEMEEVIKAKDEIITALKNSPL